MTAVDTTTDHSALESLLARDGEHADLLELGRDAQDLLFRAARTANSFTDEPVTDAQVRAIHDLVKWAPTSMNIQPLRVVLVRTPDSRARLVEHMSDGNKAKTSTAPLVAILAADTDFHDEMHKTFPIRENARDIFLDDTTREATARVNALLQVAYFILGVRAAGLAAGPMTGFDVAGVDAEFFPDGKHRALVVVNVGHAGANAWFDRLPRLDFEDVYTEV